MDSNTDEWLSDALPKHQGLTDSVVTIVSNLLTSAGVDFLSVKGRTKTRKSILEKLDRKRYKDARTELTDISGIRVITFLESDVDKVCQIIESAFNVDEGNSLNKSALLGVKTLGYRSVHYVCDLGTARSALPEFKNYEGLMFEFQIRTVLQHAWAELAHDRNYKFTDKLPVRIERMLHLYAGMLEIADKGLDDIALEIDRYINRIETKAKTGDLSTTINSLSLRQFLPTRAEAAAINLEKISMKQGLKDILGELRRFGLRSLQDIDNLFDSSFLTAYAARDIKSNTLHGLLRDLMMYSDIEKYFGKSWKGAWSVIGVEEFQFLAKKYGSELVNQLLDEREITIEPAADTYNQ